MAASLEFIIKAVDEASGQLEQVARSLRAVSAQAAETGSRFAEASARMADAGKVLAGIGAAAGAALGLVVRQTQVYGEEIDRAAKQTGIAAEEIARLGYAASQEHASLDQLTTGLKFLARHMADAASGNREAQATFQALGIAVRDSHGNLRPLSDVLLEVADRFKATEDATLKTELATRLFGRSGAELIPFLNQGAEVIRAYGREADTLGLTLGSKAVAAAEQFGDAVQALSSAVRGLVVQLGSALIPVLGPVVTTLTRVIALIAQWAREHQPLVAVLGTVAAAVAGLSASLGGLLLVLPTLVRGWQLFSAGLAAVRVALAAATSGALQFLAAWGPWIALGAAVAAAVAIIIRNLDNLGVALQGIGRALAGFGQILLGALTLDWGRVKAGWDQAVAGAAQVKDALGAIVRRIGDDIRSALDAARNALRLPELQQLPSLAAGAASGVAPHAVRLADLLRKPGNAVRQTAQDVDDATNFINGVLVERGRAWEGYASEAVRALGWLGQSTKLTMQAAAEVIKAEEARLAAELQATINEFVNTMGPALVRAGQQWQGLASEASRAAGWMGQSTRESAAAAQDALRAWDQYVTTRIQQMQHEVTMGRMTRDELIAQLQQMLQAGTLTAQQRMQVEQLLTSETQRLVQERVAAMRHEVEMGRMSAGDYAAALQQMLQAAQTNTAERMRLEQELVNTVVQAVQQRARALQDELGQGQLTLEQWRQVFQGFVQQHGIAAEQAEAAWRRIAGAVQQAAEQTRSPIEQMGAITNNLQRAFENFFVSVATGSKSLGQALGDLASQIWQAVVGEIVRALAQIVAKWLAAAIASIWGSLVATYGIFAPLFIGVALALIAWISGLVKLAKGGLVMGPTLALVGEAGPELVVPLDRVREFAGGSSGMGDAVEARLARIEQLLERRLRPPRPEPVIEMSRLAVDRELSLRVGLGASTRRVLR